MISKSILPFAAAWLLATTAAQSAVILADDFTGVSKLSSVATIGAYDTQNGVVASLSFTARNGTDGTGALVDFETRPNELDPNSRNDAAWNITSSFALDSGTQSISLTSLSMLAYAVNSSGGDRAVNSNTPLAWTISITGDGSYGTQTATVVNAFAVQPALGSANPVIDLSSLGELVAGENYTYRISMIRNSGEYMYVTLNNFSLEGDITPVPEPSSASLLCGLAGLALLVRCRK